MLGGSLEWSLPEKMGVILILKPAGHVIHPQEATRNNAPKWTQFLPKNIFRSVRVRFRAPDPVAAPEEKGGLRTSSAIRDCPCGRRW